MAQTVILYGPPQRDLAKQLIIRAPRAAIVTIREAKRSEEQSAKFHAMCSELARSPVQWAGKRRSAAQWKLLLVSGHSVATKAETEIVPGLEGEFVNIRESTAHMSIARASSLIEYTIAWGAEHGVTFNEPGDGASPPKPERADGQPVASSPEPHGRAA